MTTILLDRDAGVGYYLAFDLLLARAPLEDGRVVPCKSTVVYPSSDPPESPARLAAIRLALLEAEPSGEGWRSLIDEAEADARREAAEAGLGEPPRLESTEMICT